VVFLLSRSTIQTRSTYSVPASALSWRRSHPRESRGGDVDGRLIEVRAMLCHRSAATTERYAHLVESALKRQRARPTIARWFPLRNV
jgi:hypothetical protein